MSDDPENLTLVYLRRLDANMQDVLRILADHSRRLNRIEAEIGRLVRDRGDDIESRAELRAEVDRMREEIDRIKRRLDISDA